MKRKAKPKMERRWVVLELFGDEWYAPEGTEVLLHATRAKAEQEAASLRRWGRAIVRPVMVPKVTR